MGVQAQELSQSITAASAYTPQPVAVAPPVNTDTTTTTTATTDTYPLVNSEVETDADPGVSIGGGDVDAVAGEVQETAAFTAEVSTWGTRWQGREGERG